MLDETEAHLIFPTVIYTAQLNNYREYNKVILDNIEPYNFETLDEQNDIYRMTGEHIGKINMHHNSLFQDFFRQISIHAKSYVDLLGVKSDVFEYYITKTWLSILDKPGNHMNYHIHSNSDISFVYYLEVPADADCLSFKNVHRPNQLFSGMMDDDRFEQDKTFLKERNVTNYNSFFIPPREGLLVMWPGNLPHGTVPNPNLNKLQDGRRCGLAGDFNLILKSGYNDFESGRISLDYLRKFN